MTITNEFEDKFTKIGKPKPEKVSKTKKKPVRSARKSLILNLDKLVKEIVLDRDLHCVVPPPKNGHSDVRQPGHLISRTRESVRWDLYNVNEQCSGDNMLHEFFPHKYISWFIEKFGLEQYNRLCEDAVKVQKLQLYELQELFDQLKKIRQKQIVENLQGNKYAPYFTQQEILSGLWSEK